MQVQDVLNGQQALFALSQKALPSKVAYRIAKAINQSKSVAKEFDRARYNMIAGIEGVTLSEDKKSFNIDGKEGEVEAGIKTLLEEECSVSFLKVNMSELGDMQIEPVHLAALDGWLIMDLQVVEGERQAEELAVKE